MKDCLLLRTIHGYYTKFNRRKFGFFEKEFAPYFIASKFSETLKQNNLLHIRYADLRLTTARLLLAQGLQLKEIQESIHDNESVRKQHCDFAIAAKQPHHSFPILSCIETSAVHPLIRGQEKASNRDPAIGGCSIQCPLFLAPVKITGASFHLHIVDCIPLLQVCLPCQKVRKGSKDSAKK